LRVARVFFAKEQRNILDLLYVNYGSGWQAGRLRLAGWQAPAGRLAGSGWQAGRQLTRQAVGKANSKVK